ncbi:MAG: competence/damage-inducible protein A [Deltaproteobacteria bacterium]|uniref:CinA-like protein n=1 Tax=Candidatus Zymogenus saltonus TaxID=2844893 RepID=A0A9D8KGV2_9DELT|nr:competence/damage-inducible protein A [Candidatus Zymogenus saltonus]
MRGEIITIGNELLSGHVTDTNATFIADRLFQFGIETIQITTVGDDEVRIVESLKTAVSRADVVVVTGGLGPTPDDITSKAVAKGMGLRLVLFPEALDQIEAKYEKRGIKLGPGAERQALMPAGSEMITNPVGTAPGYHILQDEKHVFVLPGVPEEMTVMMDQGVLTIIAERLRRGSFVAKKVLKVFGLTESQVYERVKDIPYDRDRIKVGFLPIFPENHVTITARSKESMERAEELVEGIEKKMRVELGERVFGEDDETLDMVVSGMLITGGLTLAVSESCTGGLLSKRLTEVPGSSAYFKSGIVSYSNEAKSYLIGVDPVLISTKGAVSSDVAEAMALGVKRSAKTDIGISITGIAGPSGGTEEKPVGTVFIGLAYDDDRGAKRKRSEIVVSKGYKFIGDRGRIRLISSEMALEWLRRCLLGKKVSEVGERWSR